MTTTGLTEPREPFDYDAAVAAYRAEHDRLTVRVGTALRTVASAPVRTVAGVGSIFRGLR